MAKQELTMHVRHILDLLDADAGASAYEYAQGLTKPEAALIAQGLRDIADAVTLAAFPDSTEASLIKLGRVSDASFGG